MNKMNYKRVRILIFALLSNLELVLEHQIWVDSGNPIAQIAGLINDATRESRTMIWKEAYLLGTSTPCVYVAAAVDDSIVCSRTFSAYFSKNASQIQREDQSLMIQFGLFFWEAELRLRNAIK